MDNQQEAISGVNRKMIGTASHHLLLAGLNQLYSTEDYLIRIVPHFIDASTSEALRGAIMKHLDQTRFHVKRLSRIFTWFNELPDGRDCQALKGVCEEAEQLVHVTTRGTLLRDAAVIMGIRRIEYYEYTSYDSLAALAELMDHTNVTTLLKETQKEEEEAFRSLDKLEEQSVNPQTLKE